MGFAFPKSHRLLRREEFLNAQRDGRKRHAGHLLVVLVGRGDTAPPRLGLVTSRKVGKAVDRNRFRRVVRELFRLEPERFPVGTDIVVIAKDGAGVLASDTIRDEVRAALQRRPKPGDDAKPR